jgi:hypothetical protein
MLICCRPNSSTVQPALGPAGSTSPLLQNSDAVVPGGAAAPEPTGLPPGLRQESSPGLTHTLPTIKGDVMKLDCLSLKVLTQAIGHGDATLSGANQAQLLAFLSVLMEGPFVAKSLLKRGPYGELQPGPAEPSTCPSRSRHTQPYPTIPLPSLTHGPASTGSRR